MSYKILFSNIGYAKGIDGSLAQHVGRFGRHFYTAPTVQEQVLAQIKGIIDAERPDLCCFVEIDYGSLHSAGFNQIESLMDTEYRFHDIADKYGHGSLLGRMPLHAGKSNAFLARHDLSFERLYFTHGTKRLIYRLAITDDVTVFFSHFSLSRKTRRRQFAEISRLLRKEKGEVIILADFNIFGGFGELEVLLRENGLHVLNREEEHTFRFFENRLVLDLCLCSPRVRERTHLKIVPQPFSDHAALVVDIS